MGVSRTVVREAVAALRAEGLVTTRQGSGAFVAADASRVPFRIDPEGLSSIDGRAGGDGAAPGDRGGGGGAGGRARHAGAARRHRRAPCAPSRPPSRAARARSTRTSPSIAPSPRPRAIRSFAELLEFLGRHVIPRQSVRVSLSTPEEQRHYLVRIQKEHGRIFEAIARPAIRRTRARPCART